MSTLAMEEEDSNTSSFTGSPSMTTSANGSFDLSSYFVALANPDLSSSSSESQSQGSRAASPTDWMAMAGLHQQPDSSWKWDADALISSGIDPNALILGNEQLNYDHPMYPPSIPTFQFEQPIPTRDMMTIQSQLPSQFQQHQQQAQLQYLMPGIVESSNVPAYVSHEPVIHAPQPQRPIAPPPVATLSVPAVTGSDADSIGRRARELSGITYAVTPAQHAEALRLQQQQQQQQPPALPQLPQNLISLQNGQGYHNAFSAIPQSSSSPTPSSSAGSSGASPNGIAQSYMDPKSASRTKTSHTTIERRYRTNLNTRIVALRHAVPALRILEKDKFPYEKADERGYVDGVKAARKASKGSILGKAAEYIGSV